MVFLRTSQPYSVGLGLDAVWDVSDCQFGLWFAGLFTAVLFLCLRICFGGCLIAYSSTALEFNPFLIGYCSDSVQCDGLLRNCHDWPLVDFGVPVFLVAAALSSLTTMAQGPVRKLC